MQIREEIPSVWDSRNFSFFISPTQPCLEEGRGLVAYFLTQTFHPDSETKWFRDKRMHSSAFLPFTQRSWKENERFLVSTKRTPVLAVHRRSSSLPPPPLIPRFNRLDTLLSSSMSSSFFRKRKPMRTIEQRKEKKRREDGKTETWYSKHLAIVLFFTIRLSLYIFIQGKNCTCFDKKKKKLLRRQEYAKFDHRGFHRKNVFSKNDTEIVTTVVGRWDGR